MALVGAFRSAGFFAAETLRPKWPPRLAVASGTAYCCDPDLLWPHECAVRCVGLEALVLDRSTYRYKDDIPAALQEWWARRHR